MVRHIFLSLPLDLSKPTNRIRIKIVLPSICGHTSQLYFTNITLSRGGFELLPSSLAEESLCPKNPAVVAPDAIRSKADLPPVPSSRLCAYDCTEPTGQRWRFFLGAKAWVT